MDKYRIPSNVFECAFSNICDVARFSTTPKQQISLLFHLIQTYSKLNVDIRKQLLVLQFSHLIKLCAEK